MTLPLWHIDAVIGWGRPSHCLRTIASLAVADSRLDGSIKTLICLATPFTYVVRSTQRRIQTGVLAVASVWYALYWSALLFVFPWLPSLGTNVFAGVVAIKSLIAFAVAAVFAMTAHDVLPNLRPTGPQRSNVVLLRGSRDEATLVLSAAQVINWTFHSFASLHDVTMPTIRRPATWIAYGVIYSACLWAGVLVAIKCQSTILGSVTPELVPALGIFVYAPAVAGIVFLAGSLALAVAAGFWDLRSWMTSAIEVETTPPNTTCQIHVFSQVTSSSLRHGLYEDEAVLKLVAELANA